MALLKYNFVFQLGSNRDILYKRPSFTRTQSAALSHGNVVLVKCLGKICSTTMDRESDLHWLSVIMSFVVVVRSKQDVPSLKFSCGENQSSLPATLVSSDRERHVQHSAVI